nr:hypothetical protein AMTR_s00071p00160560 [Tanacetum cinerariifolium]
VPAEVLYSNNRSTARHRVYEHYSEQRVLCVREKQINLRLCNDESYESLRNSGFQQFYLGIFMIRLHALHRRSAGTNALVFLRDTRWVDSLQIIATIEVDLSVGTQLVYTFPDMILSVNDFHNHVEVALQTHGYDKWQGGKSNLLITMALTGRLSNTSYMGFQYSVENVVDHLTTNGITAIPGERTSIKDLEGMNWNLNPPEQTSVRVPSRVAVNERLNKSVTTGWGEEFSNDEVTPGRVTILNKAEEESNWDDDERSGGKTLVIQEKLAQNQQDFLDEYLPQWDDKLATQKQRSELKWENPFAAKRGEDHTVLHSLKEKDDDLPYPKFRNFEQLAAQIVKKHEEHAFPTAADDAESSTSYQPPPDTIMGPAVYPPARQNTQQTYKPDYQFGYPQGKGNTFYRGYGEYHNSQWTLPPAWTESGVMLVLPVDPGLWDLDRITCEETKNLWSFLKDFKQLAIKSGKLYFPLTTKILFAKLPPSLSKKIEESFKVRHPGLSAGFLLAIKFTHTFVSKMYKDAALAKELRDLSLCSSIPILGYYKNNRKKYGIRKSRTYKGKPHNSHVKPFKRKYKDDRGRVKKCKCFICGKEGYFAKDCRSKKGNIARSAVYQELDLDDNWDIVSVDFDDSSVYSISEGEEESDDEQDIEEDYDSHHAFMFHPGPPTKIADMVQSAGSWKPDKELPTQSKSCEHDWKENAATNYTICYYCRILTTDMDQAKEYYESKIAIKEKEELWKTERSLLMKDLTDALKIIDQLKAEQMKHEEEKDEEIRRLKAQLHEKKDKEIKVQFSKEEFPPLGNSQIARPFMEVEAHYSRSTTTAPKIRKITNQLYNVKVEFKIPSCPMFGTTAIIDTWASACCINKKVIPEEALEPLTQTVFFNGMNSRQQATHKIKQGYFLIEGYKFKIPLIYAFDMRDSN